MYAKITNNTVVKFPYSMGDLHVEHPDTSFPETPTAETLAAFNVYEVTQTAAPAVDSKTHRQMQTVQQVDGVWTQVWTVQQLPEDKAAANVRGYRDSLLAECDWTQVVDAPVDQATWAAYRQALRDISAQESFPWSVEWPTQPA